MKHIFTYIFYILLVTIIIYYLYFYTEVFQQNIPKIIIQTWKTNNVPEKYKSYIEKLKFLHPDYQYLFFTDEQIEIFLKNNYPSYYETYKKLPLIIQKIDFFRYIAVYHYGGFYLDLDIYCQNSFDEILKYDCIFPVDDYIKERQKHIPRYAAFNKQKQSFLLGQYAFASIPRQDFLKQIIENIHSNINDYVKNVNANSDDYVYQTTGPDFVTQNYIDYKNKKNITILDNGKRQCFGDFATHKCMGSWK